MKNPAIRIGLPAVLFALGLSSMAVADPAGMTCGDFAKLDAAGRMTYAHELLSWINDPANEATVGPALIGKYGPMQHDEATDQTDVLEMSLDHGWTHLQMKIEIEAHCIRMPDTTNVVDILRAHT